MKFLFIHRRYPGQFMHLASELVANGHDVLFICETRREDTIIKKSKIAIIPPITLEESDKKSPSKEQILKMYYTAENYGRVMQKLRDEQGYEPDMIISHPDWGGSFYVKDIFPNAAFVAYCEWYNTKGEFYHFFDRGKAADNSNPARFAPGRQKNVYLAGALLDCDAGYAPMAWQKAQYPPEFQHKISVIHDGIDTSFFSPGQEESSQVHDLDLSQFPEIVTYGTSGIEPYRGFPAFYQAIPAILEARPECHIVVMASDKAFYSPELKDGKTYLQLMREKVPAADSPRVHFLKFSNYMLWRRFLRHSSLHVYLTAPFFLSWSCLEAMSCECLVVSSDTTPVKEVIRDHENGLLAPFFDSKKLASTIIYGLEKRVELEYIRKNARKTIQENYERAKCVRKQFNLLERVLTERKRAMNNVAPDPGVFA